MKKTLIAMAMAMSLSIILSGCGPAVSETENARFVVVMPGTMVEEGKEYYRISIIKDTETGVLYLRDMSGGITPLLDKEGKPTIK